MDRDNIRARFRTDYSAESVNSPEPPYREPSEIVTSQPKKSKKILVIISLLLILGAAGLTWVLMNKNSDDPTPPAVKSSVSLPIYYPTKLPNGFVVESNSYQSNGEVLTYNAVAADGTKIIFSIQPRPATFDFQTFYQKGLVGTEQFTTPAGQAAIGRAQNKLLGNLVTDASWVIVSSSSPSIKSTDLRLILENIRKSN